MKLKNKKGKRLLAVLLSSAVGISGFGALPYTAPNVGAAVAVNSQAPAAVTALSYKSGADYITLSWKASTDIDGYYINIKAADSDAYYRADTIEDGTATSWTKRDLSSGKIFQYRVIPYKKVGTRIIAGEGVDIITSTLPANVKRSWISDASTTSLKLNWTAVNGADGYYIYRKPSKDSSYKCIKGISGKDNVSWTDTNLSAGTDYDYSIRAYKIADGKKLYSGYTICSASTVTGRLSGLKVANYTTNTIELKWDVSNGASGYYIYIKSNDGNYYRTDTIEKGSITSWKKEGLSSGKDFDFKVAPYKTVGTKNILGEGAEISAFTLPGDVKRIVFSDNTASSVKMKWVAVNGADGYYIYRKLSTDRLYKCVKVISDQAVTEWTDTSLSAGKDYNYSIRAYKKSNEKTGYGTYVISQTGTAPAALKTLCASVPTKEGEITLNWKAVAGADGYYIYIQSANDANLYYKYDTVENGAATSWKKNGLSSGKIFNFRVIPYRTVGEKIYRGESKDVSTGTLPGSVKKVVLSDPTTNAVTVNWFAVSGADGYDIFRKLGGEANYKKLRAIKDPTATSWRDTGLSAGVDCEYYVRAYKVVNGRVVYGTLVTGKGYTFPEGIENLSVKEYTEESVTLSWSQAEGADGYDIFRLSSKDGKYYKVGTVESGTVTEFTNENLTPGNDFTYKVMAYKTFGDGKRYGSESYVNASTLTASVRALKVDERTENSIRLTWKPTNGAEGYIIYKKAEGERSFSECARIAAKEDNEIVSWTDSGISSATEVTYRITTYSMVDEKFVESDMFSDIIGCTLPAEVKNLKASTTVSSVTLTWDKVEGASGYIILRQNLSDPTKYNKIETIENGNITKYLHKDLSSSVDYTYHVEAYKNVGERSFSGDYGSVTCCTHPAQPAHIRAKAQGSTFVTLTWGPSPRVDGYKIYRVDGNNYTLVASVDSSIVEYNVKGLKSGSTYKFAVSGYKNYTYFGAKTVEGEKIKLDAITSPAITTSFTATSRTSDTITFKWNAVSGASGYYLYKKNNDTNAYYRRAIINGGNTTTYRDDELAQGVKQEYRLMAYKELDGKVAVGGYKELTTYTLPKTPDSAYVVNKTDKAIRFTWYEVTGAAGYRIERKASNEKSYKFIANVRGQSNNTYVDDGLKSGVTYSYRIYTYKTINNNTAYSGYRAMGGKTFSQADINNMKAEIIRLVNIERNKVGLNSLSTRTAAAAGSDVRAKEISTKFDHTRPNGKKYYTAFNVNYTFVGENIGHHANMTANNIVQLWMESPGHRANILNNRYTSTSVGIYMDIYSNDVIYAAQNFFG